MSKKNGKDKGSKFRYVVVDETGNVCWNGDDEAPESFKNFNKARDRAAELAKSSPGETIRIYEIVHEVVADVGPVTFKDVDEHGVAREAEPEV